MEDAIIRFLKEEDRETWQRYLRLRERGQRRPALDLLTQLANQISRYPEATLREMVYAICQAQFDRQQPQTIQRPLYQQVIFPQLLAGYLAQKPPYARWLAQVAEQFSSFWKDSAAVLQERNQGFWRGDLLRDALTVDPDDQIAAEKYATLMVMNFDYYIHEIPLGILAEPETFRQQLDEFVALFPAQAATKYSQDIATWRFYCECSADYRSKRAQFASFADYLDAREPDYRSLFPLHHG